MRNLEHEKRFLLAASWLFYMSWGPRFVLLIVFTSLVDWWIGRCLGETEDPGRRRRLLVTSLVLNLGVLAFFKYTNFVRGQRMAGLAGPGMGARSASPSTSCCPSESRSSPSRA